MLEVFSFCYQQRAANAINKNNCTNFAPEKKKLTKQNESFWGILFLTW